MRKAIEDLEGCLTKIQKFIHNLLDDFQRAEMSVKNAEVLIHRTEDIIAKAKVMICDNEILVELEKKNMEELSAEKAKLDQDFVIQSSELEARRLQYT